MEMQFVFDEMTHSLVSPAYSRQKRKKKWMWTYYRCLWRGTARHSDDSDIEVIACYRHVPIVKTDYAPQNDN